MNDETRKRLLDALAACRAIEQFVAGREFNAYEQYLMLRSAVERQLEIVGEALSRAADSLPELATTLPDLPLIVGRRNRIVHGYDSVDDELIWDTVKFDVPKLATRLAQLLGELPNDV